VIDLGCSLFLLALGAGCLGAYVVRVSLVGRARDRRLDSEAGVMLGRSVMEMTYWASEPLVRLLLRFRITPNAITAASLVPALLSALAVGAGHMGVAAVLALCSGYCDILDGMVARRSGVASNAGEVFDAAVDRYVEFILLAGLTFRYGAGGGAGSVLLQVLALGAILASFMVSYATAKAEALGVEPPKGAMRRAERSVYLIVGLVLTPVTAHLLGARAESLYLHDFPVLVAMTLVAVVGNASAIRRLRQTARLVRARDAERSRELVRENRDAHATAASALEIVPAGRSPEIAGS
jgi:CDP-diacylglycerol--glycerol-3-phosphate 3-phosphatidyltransferase